MPSKRKKSDGATRTPELTIPPALLDQVVKGPMTQRKLPDVVPLFDDRLELD